MWILWLGALACKKDKDADPVDSGQPTDETTPPLERLVINEAKEGDFLELLNLDDHEIALDAYELRSSSEDQAGGIVSHPLEGTLAPQQMLLIEQASLPFQLSNQDKVLLLNAAGRTVDEADWGKHDAFPSWGRFPDGTGEFRTLLIATPGAPNTDAVPEEESPFQVVINEVTSAGEPVDLVELFSLEAEAVSLQGWWYIDAGQDGREMIGTQLLAPGGFVVLDGHGFGLKDSGEELLLFDADNRLVDRVAWGDGEATTSFCRVPDGSDPPRPCSIATFGAANSP